MVGLSNREFNFMASTIVHASDRQPTRNGTLRDYIQLTKPKIVTLLVFTTVTAMVVAAQGQGMRADTLIATILGGALAAGGASALNQWYDRDMDALMARTRHRPIPAGRVRPRNALLFGMGLLVWSALILYAFVNPLTAGLAMFGAFYYVVGYTMLLKRNTVLNILIGGGAGAFPVLVGWAAIANVIAPQALLLFAIVFFWTPPHSWALALMVNKDYAHANVPMYPVAHGEQAARIQILLYSVQLVVLSILPIPFRMSGGFYLITALALDAGLIIQAIRLLQDPSSSQSRSTYKYTTLYLTLLFLVMMIDQFVRLPIR